MKHRHCLKTENNHERKKHYSTNYDLYCLVEHTNNRSCKNRLLQGYGSVLNYGRNAKVFGFSDCNSQNYEHCSSCNGYSSGWEQPGTLSKAWGWIGTATLEAYWNCR